MDRRAFILAAASAAAPIAAHADDNGIHRPRILMTGYLGNIGSRLYPLIGGIVDGIDVKNGVKEDLAETGMPWTKKLFGITDVIHLAARPYDQDDVKITYRNGVLATANLLRTCMWNGVHRVIIASSFGIDPAGNGWTECFKSTEPPTPLNPYGRAKVLNEEILRNLSVSGLISSAVAVRVGWAPPEDAAPDPRQNQFRVHTMDLLSTFADALVAPNGYTVKEMVRQKRTLHLAPFDHRT